MSALALPLYQQIISELQFESTFVSHWYTILTQCNCVGICKRACIRICIEMDDSCCYLLWLVGGAMLHCPLLHLRLRNGCIGGFLFNNVFMISMQYNFDCLLMNHNSNYHLTPDHTYHSNDLKLKESRFTRVQEYSCELRKLSFQSVNSWFWPTMS